MKQSKPVEDAEIIKKMGFNAFKSTKQSKVYANNIYCCKKIKKRQIRQRIKRIDKTDEMEQ